MSKLLNSVIKDYKDREKRGKKTYGVTMDRKDLTPEEWLNHLYEELLDAVLYLKKYEHSNRNTQPVKRPSTGKANRTNRTDRKKVKASQLKVNG